MSINQEVLKLVKYGKDAGLIEELDEIYVRNSILDQLKLDDFQEESIDGEEINLPAILDALMDDAYARGVMASDDIVSRDLFDTRLMNTMVDRPALINKKFWDMYKENPVEATDWFYKFSQDTNYIRRDRLAKDRKWTVESPYGTIDITINLSKPEKDPKAIAAAKNAPQSSYPKCQLCIENEGYAGRMNHPARQTHRIIQIVVDNNTWGFQYSPYGYYNEHCIVFNGQHTPMKIEKKTFAKLFDFVKQFNHYFLGSNADLPIVGGSILSHDHFQGGHYTFAMENAEMEKTFTIAGFEDITAGIVKWPLSVIRLQGKDTDRIIECADHILGKWRGYTDEEAYIYAETDGEAHNTITPIARKKGEFYELDLTLRNNITTEECPMGLYHPHAEYHHIKKENIGLIEVMGLAVLPARLKKEMEEMEAYLLKTGEVTPSLEQHMDWLKEVEAKYSDINADNVTKILEEEIGQVFVKVLEDAGVYKCTEEGRKAFDRFVGVL